MKTPKYHDGDGPPYSPPNPADPEECTATLSDPPDVEQTTVEIRTAHDGTLDLPAAPHEEHAGSRFAQGPPLSQSDERIGISLGRLGLGPGAHRMPGPSDHYQPQEEPATREHERHEDAEAASQISNDEEADGQIPVAEPVSEPSSTAIRIRNDQETSGTTTGVTAQDLQEAECSIVLPAMAVFDAEDPIVERHPRDLVHDDIPSNYLKSKRLPFHLCMVVSLIGVAIILGLSRPWSRLDTVVDDGNLIQSKQCNATTTDAYGLNNSAIHAPPMPTSMSGILAEDHTMFLKGLEAPLAFSGDCTVVAASIVDEWKDIVQTITYDTSSDEWLLLDDELTSGNLAAGDRFNLAAGDRFGDWLDFSENGLILAVAMPRSSPDGIPEAGSVRVYSRSTSASQEWKPMGSDINGDEYEWLGTTVSLSSDGLRIAIASPRPVDVAGRYTVHQFVDNEWKQLGSDILGETSKSRTSFAKISADGSTLVLGAPIDGTGSSVGSLRIFRFDEKELDWVQVGRSFYGEAGSFLGVHPQASKDGKTIAFSGLGWSRVYNYHPDDDEWNQVGKDFESMVCMDISSDGTWTIMCSAVLSVAMNCCHIYHFDDTTKDWDETSYFDPDLFVPLAFSTDGKNVCGINGEGTTTIGFYTFG